MSDNPSQDAEAEAMRQIGIILDMPPGATPEETVQAVKETLSSYWRMAGDLKIAMEKAFPASTPGITQG